jgi:hypothetical protein
MYRVILTKNGEYKKTLHRSKTRETSFINYHKLLENNKVVFPRKFINYDGIKPVEYKIYCVKDTEKGDKFRVLRDNKGKLYEEKPLFDIWTVLDDSSWEIEETFWLYGHDPIHDRKTIGEIMVPMMQGAYKQKMVKQIIVVHNKLICWNEDEFTMVICKCKEDAQRLHHRIAKAAKSNKIKSFIFMGTASPATVSQMYDVILENTDWPIEKIRRTSTRP